LSPFLDEVFSHLFVLLPALEAQVAPGEAVKSGERTLQKALGVKVLVEACVADDAGDFLRSDVFGYVREFEDVRCRQILQIEWSGWWRQDGDGFRWAHSFLHCFMM